MAGYHIAGDRTITSCGKEVEEDCSLSSPHFATREEAEALRDAILRSLRERAETEEALLAAGLPSPHEEEFPSAAWPA